MNLTLKNSFLTIKGKLQSMRLSIYDNNNINDNNMKVIF